MVVTLLVFNMAKVTLSGKTLTVCVVGLLYQIRKWITSSVSLANIFFISQVYGVHSIQDRIEAAEKSRQTIVSECVSLEQQLSASESSRAALSAQFEQLGQEVEGYRKTIQQHVSLAASAKVRNLKILVVFIVIIIIKCYVPGKHKPYMLPSVLDSTTRI